MIPITQTRLHITSPDGGVIQKGNCYQAAIASLFELQLNQVPNFIEYPDNEWVAVFNKFVADQGYEYSWHYANDDLSSNKGWSIGSGISPRSRKDCKLMHAVVCYDGEIVFDPHPDRTGLLGGVVYYEVFTKLSTGDII